MVRRYVREVSKPNMERHGFTMIGPWEALAGTTNTLHYILEWANSEERERCWEAFYADTIYVEGRAAMFREGEVALRAHVQFWKPMGE